MSLRLNLARGSRLHLAGFLAALLSLTAALVAVARLGDRGRVDGAVEDGRRSLIEDGVDPVQLAEPERLAEPPNGSTPRVRVAAGPALDVDRFVGLAIEVALGGSRYESRFHPGRFCALIARLSAMEDEDIRSLVKALPWREECIHGDADGDSIVTALAVALYEGGSEVPEYWLSRAGVSAFDCLGRDLDAWPLIFGHGLPFHLGSGDASRSILSRELRGPGRHVYTGSSHWIEWMDGASVRGRVYPPSRDPLACADAAVDRALEILAGCPGIDGEVLALLEAGIRVQALACIDGDLLRVLSASTLYDVESVVDDDAAWSAWSSAIRRQDAVWLSGGDFGIQPR